MLPCVSTLQNILLSDNHCHILQAMDKAGMETLAEEEKAQKSLSRVTEKDVRNLLKRYPKTLKH